jgi:hypothetical protein
MTACINRAIAFLILRDSIAPATVLHARCNDSLWLSGTVRSTRMSVLSIGLSPARKHDALRVFVAVEVKPK